jgi:hypothetical protein
MSTAASGENITMDTFNLTSLSSSIYELGSVTFINDTNAYITIDIN